MSDWHSSNSGEWTIGSRLITGYGGGVGTYAASYAIDLASGPLLNGSVSAGIQFTDRWAAGAGLVCRADRNWTFVAFYAVSENADGNTAVARFGAFREGLLIPVAQLAEPVRLGKGYHHFSLEFFSGRMRGEIRTAQHTYELTANCPHVPFPGHAGLVKFYGSGLLAKSWTVERSHTPFAAPAPRRAGGQEYEFSVFLCHASEDTESVQLIAKALAAKGIRYWLDSEQINFGDRVSEKIEAGLRASRYILPCVSPALTERGWTRAEFGSVLNAELSGDSSRMVIPLMLTGAETDDIPLLFRDKRRVSSTNKVEFEEFVSFLLSH